MTSSYIQQRMRRARCLMAIAASLVIITGATAQQSESGQYQITVLSLEFGEAELVTYDIQGENPQRFGPEGLKGSQPAWSPDGRQLTFFLRQQGEIFLFDKHTATQTQLTHSSRQKMNPAWSPDSEKIAFQWILEKRHRVFVMNADGSGTIEIEPEWSGQKFDPAWSPNGKFLAFSIEGRIVLVNSQTYKREPIGVALEGTNPTWSPDSRMITVHNREGQILVGDTINSNVRRLTENGGYNSTPVWSPDGRYIAYRRSSASPWREDVLCDLVVFDIVTESHKTILHGKLPTDDSRPSWKPFPTEAAN